MCSERGRQLRSMRETTKCVPDTAPREAGHEPAASSPVHIIDYLMKWRGGKWGKKKKKSKALSCGWDSGHHCCSGGLRQRDSGAVWKTRISVCRFCWWEVGVTPPHCRDSFGFSSCLLPSRSGLFLGLTYHTEDPRRISACEYASWSGSATPQHCFH